MWESASHRTILSIMAPQTLPIAPVKVIFSSTFDVSVDSGEIQNLELFGPARALPLPHVTHFLAQQSASDRACGENLPIRRIGLFAGYQGVCDLLVAPAVENHYRRS